MMVAGFRRSISLPMSNSTPNSPCRHKCRPASEKSYHIRSTSLPCRSHPVISQLEDEICGVRTWQSRAELEQASPAWLCDGLSRLEQLHDSVDDLLQLPQAQDCLRQSACAERLLEDFLRLADAYGTFRSTVMDLEQCGSEASVAIRRKDETGLGSCARSQKKAEKVLTKLASSIRDVARLPATTAFARNGAEAELAGILREVIAASAHASMLVFLGIASISSAVSTTMSSLSSRSCWMVGPLKERFLSSSPSSKKLEEREEEGNARRLSSLEKLQGLEECLVALETKSKRVFRSLVNTRVSLLNILTPSM